MGYYLSARVIEGIGLKLMKEGYIPEIEAFNKTYTLIWGFVMFLFELDSRVLNGSLVSSMNFLYKNSDKPLTHYSELVPFDIPRSLLGK